MAFSRVTLKTLTGFIAQVTHKNCLFKAITALKKLAANTIDHMPKEFCIKCNKHLLVNKP